MHGGQVGAFLQKHRTLARVAGIAAGFLLVVFLLWLFVGPETPGDRISFIGTMGGIVGGAALISGLYFTARNVQLNARNLQVNQEGQITERFTRAIDQLGRNEEGGKLLEIRLGGIYALERIARDSERDHWPIMEVLTAYVRHNSPRESIGDPSKEATEEEAEEPSKLNPSDNGVAGPDADIQTIMNVLGRRTRYLGAGESRSLNLDRTNLKGAHMWEANLERVSFVQTDLGGANLEGANLSGARNLTQEQLDTARGDEKTVLPYHLEVPSSWLQRPDV